MLLYALVRNLVPPYICVRTENFGSSFQQYTQTFWKEIWISCMLPIRCRWISFSFLNTRICLFPASCQLASSLEGQCSGRVLTESGEGKCCFYWMCEGPCIRFKTFQFWTLSIHQVQCLFSLMYVSVITLHDFVLYNAINRHPHLQVLIVLSRISPESICLSTPIFSSYCPGLSFVLENTWYVTAGRVAKKFWGMSQAFSSQ